MSQKRSIVFTPTLRLHLDSDALINNWRTLGRLSGKAETGAAVKANGYGLGAVKTVQLLSGAGCKDFFVAHWQEALELNNHAYLPNISVLNGILPQDIAGARQLGAKPVINSVSQAKLWSDAGGGTCDLMIDSGINRLGIRPDDVSLPEIKALNIDICMSHLASADENSGQNAAQQKLFDAMRNSVAARRYSLANSAGICLGDEYHYDLTRPGLALYGGIPRRELADKIKPVAGIDAAILQVSNVEAGAKIGYNASFVAPKNMRLATLAIGYADGYLRSFSGKGRFLHNGDIISVVGRVSMDLTILDISDHADLKEGDWLTLDYDLVRNAKLSNLSQYELLTGLGARFERHWSA